MGVRIYQPGKNAMQSGRAKMKQWRLEFEETAPYSVDPLMGWVSQKDTSQQLRLNFGSREKAVAYAEKHGLDYRVTEPEQRRIMPKSYADNFSYYKIST